MHGGGGTGRRVVSGDLNPYSGEVKLVISGSVSQDISGDDDGMIVAGGLVSSSMLGEGFELPSSMEDSCMDDFDSAVKRSDIVQADSVVIDACVESADSVDACMDRPLAEGICSAGGKDTLMADGELRRGGVAGKQGSLLCFADGLHVPGTCSGNFLNGAVNVSCMAQEKAEVCMDSNIKQSDELIMDAGCSSGEIHDGRISSMVVADGISPAVGISVEDACMASFDAAGKYSALVSDGPVVVDKSPVEDACMVVNDMQVDSRPEGGKGECDALILNGFHTNSNVVSAADGSSTFFFSSPQGARGMASMKPILQKSDPTPYVDKAWAHDHLKKEWQRRPVVPLPSRADLGAFAKNGNSVQLDEDVLKANLRKFDTALVGRLFGKKISFFQLRTELVRRWERFGHFRLVTLSVDCFICYFDNIAARDSVLINGPWAIAGQVLGLDRWTATFSPSSMDGFVTPVWVRLPELPLYCWDSTNIARIVASLGEPLWIDAATECMDRGAFARACVKLDLSKPLLTGVRVHSSRGEFFQRTEYEGLSTLCFRCGIVGHKEASCRAPPMTHAARPTSTRNCGDTVMMGSSKDPLEETRPVISKPHGPTVEELHEPGPWMVVQRRRRPQNKPLLPTPNATNLTGKQPGARRNSSNEDSMGRKLHPMHFPTHAVPTGGRAGNFTPPHAHSKESLPLPNSKESAVSFQAMECLHGNDHTQDKDRSTPQGQGQGVTFQPPDSYCSQALVPFEGSEKSVRTPSGRLSTTYAGRLTNGLGPLVSGDRNKKRKTAAHNVGGDASSLKPP